MTTLFHFFIFLVIALLIYIITGLESHSKQLNETKLGIRTIQTSLDTDIYNNIDLDREMSKFLNKKIRKFTFSNELEEWAITEYCKNKKDNIILAYKDLKIKPELISDDVYTESFLGNGRAELKSLYRSFPNAFLNSVNSTNIEVFLSFKDVFLYSEIIEEITNDNFFKLKMLVLDKFKQNINKIFNSLKLHSNKTDNKLFEKIIDNLDNIEYTLKNLKELNVVETYETELQLLRASYQDFIFRENSLISDNEANLEKPKLRKRTLNLLNKLKDSSNNG